MIKNSNVSFISPSRLLTDEDMRTMKKNHGVKSSLVWNDGRLFLQTNTKKRKMKITSNYNKNNITIYSCEKQRWMTNDYRMCAVEGRIDYKREKDSNLITSNLAKIYSKFQNKIYEEFALFHIQFWKRSILKFKINSSSSIWHFDYNGNDNIFTLE